MSEIFGELSPKWHVIIESLPSRFRKIYWRVGKILIRAIGVDDFKERSSSGHKTDALFISQGPWPLPENLHRFKLCTFPALKRGHRHSRPLLMKNLCVSEKCWQRENNFSFVCWVYKLYFRADPGPKSNSPQQYKPSNTFVDILF